MELRDLGHCKDHEICRRVDRIKRPGLLQRPCQIGVHVRK